MTYRVDFEAAATNSAAGFLADDEPGVDAVLARLDRIAEDPSLSDATPLGTTGVYRLRVDRYRVVYRVEGDVITVLHIGRRA